MKLADLAPEWGRSPESDGRFWLHFACPRCGGRNRIYIAFHREGPQPGIWQCTSDWRLFPSLEHLGEQPRLEDLSLEPSIFNKTHGKGLSPCGVLIRIVNGEVIAS